MSTPALTASTYATATSPPPKEQRGLFGTDKRPTATGITSQQLAPAAVQPIWKSMEKTLVITWARGDGAPLNWMLQEDAQQSVQSNVGIYGGAPGSDGRFKTDAFGNNYAADLYGQPYEFGGGLGYWYDPDLALHYIRERWYDPKTGTWLSVDPVLSEPRYSYVHQMPTVAKDRNIPSITPSYVNKYEAWYKLSASCGNIVSNANS